MKIQIGKKNKAKITHILSTDQLSYFVLKNTIIQYALFIICLFHFIHSFTIEQFLCFGFSKQKEEHLQWPWCRHYIVDF